MGLSIINADNGNAIRASTLKVWPEEFNKLRAVLKQRLSSENSFTEFSFRPINEYRPS